MPPAWEREGLSREQYGRKHLSLAFDVYFDENDKEHQGDIRYDDLQRQNDSVLASERWRSQDTPSEPPHIRHLVNGETYILGKLPLGSVFRMPDGTEHVLEMYTYMPRPSKGSSIEIDNRISDLNNSLIVKNGTFTELGTTEVILISHPNKIHFAKPSKSAATRKPASPLRTRSSSPKAAVKTPSKSSLYKKKEASRRKKVLAAKRSRRRKATGRARSASVDKIPSRRSSTRRRSK